MSIDIDLGGAAAIVTGAGRGIGAEIARTLAAAGADVAVAARTVDEIEAVAEELASTYGVRAHAVPTDLREASDIERLVDEAVAVLDHPTILVNNAAANLAGPPLEHTEAEIDTMLSVNLRGLFLLTQSWAAAFRDSPADRGRVINISSIGAETGVPAMTFYGGTKAGVRGITRGFAAALAGDGVTVNSVSPGLTRVDRIEALIDEAGEEIYDLDRIPLGRLGVPADVANVCVFLASPLADYVTGVDVLVDGGVGFTAGLYR